MLSISDCIIIRLKVLSRSVSKLQALQLIAPYRFYVKQWSETPRFHSRESLNLAKIPSNIMCASFDSGIDIISKRREFEDQMGIEDSESYCALMEHFLFLATMGQYL